MKDRIICRCEGVLYSEVKESIQSGAHTMGGVKLRTRAGMGPCQGRVCQPIIKSIVSKDEEGFIPQTTRAPLRPTELQNLIVTSED